MTLSKANMTLINTQLALSESYTANGKANIALDKAQFTLFMGTIFRLSPYPSLLVNLCALAPLWLFLR
jgi:hypothetical protein